jgi:soluble lytic murein transglycosylase-like protein
MKKLLAAILGIVILSFNVTPQSDADLRAVTEKDRSSRDASGKLMTLPAAEHAARGNVYFDNRHFPEAREHFQKVIDNYGSDPLMARALFVMGRSYMWERQYNKCIDWLDRAAREFPETKDGREALAFRSACYVRLSRHAEAAKSYEQYTVMYPAGERIDSAYLNTIDALREAGKYDEANAWVAKAQQRFTGMPTETNALHARLRMEIHRQRWAEAVAAADAMLGNVSFGGSMSSIDEVKYLKAFSLEKAGCRDEANAVYASIPAAVLSYYSGLAFEKLANSDSRVKRISQVSPTVAKVDPRFVLAIMKQESSFRPGAKSPSAARGLLQLVYDTAIKYKHKAGYPNLQADDLYNPNINIALGVEYLAALRDQFGGLNEAIAASYNGGEDNAARWLNRSKPKEPAIFSAEIGFAETKNYVFKVMNNYRVYRDLYDESLNRK